MFIMISVGYVHTVKETKTGMVSGSTNIKIQKAWPKICTFASGNDDQLLLVSLKISGNGLRIQHEEVRKNN